MAVKILRPLDLQVRKSIKAPRPVAPLTMLRLTVDDLILVHEVSKS